MDVRYKQRGAKKEFLTHNRTPITPYEKMMFKKD
jgi:hypothetical protein